MIGARHINERGVLLRFFKVVTFLMKFGNLFFACRSFSFKKSKLLYKIYLGLWIFLVTLALLYTVLDDVKRDDLSMGGVVVFLNHTTQFIAHLVILLESCTMDSKRCSLELRFAEFEKRFIAEIGTKLTDKVDESHQCQSQARIVVMAGFGILLFTALNIAIAFLKYTNDLLDTVTYWLALLSILALQFRSLEVLVDITALNEYATMLRCQIDEMGERNLNKIFGLHTVRERGGFLKGNIIWVKPHLSSDTGLQTSEEAADEERKLRACKRFYGDIYNMFKLINDHFGWSLLAFVTKYYLYFLINSYWVVLALVLNNRGYYLLINLGYLVIAVQFLCLLCWQSQYSQEQSCEIRCIMYKVVKPTGKRSYKDLVTDFSLQTLHQQYTMTAKGFFNLNLNLLGNMAAGVVTYLVILIQFMLAEKSKADRANDSSII